MTNYERRRPDRPRWSLDNMRALLAMPEHPLSAAPLVQVGGSKGKGTTALYLESLAQDAGLRTGVYMSPHLVSVLERVRLDGRDVTEAELHAGVLPVLDWANSHGAEITFFEVMTRGALACFARAGVGLGILEVGLGGRLDATTAVEVDASIVTGVELEHTELLGDTVAAIAAEKAWVVRPDRPAFTAATGDALDVLRDRAAEVGAELAVLGEDFGLVDVRPDGPGFRGALREPGGATRPFHLPDARAFELPAMALAVVCLSRLCPDLELRLEPVAQPVLPGRCEIRTCGDGYPLVLDSAHTETSATALAAELERRFPQQSVALLFASAAGKRWRETLKCLLGPADRVVVTALTGTETERPDTIVSWLRGQGVAANEVATTEDGLRELADHRGVRVVAGSFYLAGEARSSLHLLGVPS